MKKTSFFRLLAIFAVTIVVASCQPEDELVVSQPITELSASADSTVVLSDSTRANGPMKAKAISSSMIINASSYSKIPVYFYKVDPRYKIGYMHLRQLKNSDRCSWTTYVTTVGCIANVDGICRYEVSQEKVDRVLSKCETITKGDHSKAQLITTLESFVNKYDKKYVSVYLFSDDNRLTTVKEMLYHIYTYRTPFQVVSTYYKNGKKIGHYLIVFSIDWTGDIKTSTVYYTDPLDGKDGNSLNSVLKTMSYKDFLSAMIDSPRYYNALFLMPN